MRKLILCCSILFSLVGYSQSDEVTLQLENASTEEAIGQMMAQTSYQFAYNPDVLTDVSISGTLRGVPAEDAVSRLFGPHYDVKVRGTYVILLPKKPVQSKPSKAVTVQLKGEVVEAETDQQLEGVSVYEVLTLKPVLTNELGAYALDLKLPDEVAFIAISKENYQDTVIQVRRNEFWRISLRRKPKDTVAKADQVQQAFLSDKISTHAKNVNLTERRFAQLALTPGLSTNGFLGGKFTNRLSVNVLAGYSHAVEGVELGGVLNMSRSYVQGVQVSGAININGELTNGVQLAGASNVTLSDLKGWQVAGFSNHVHQAAGVQTAGGMNVSRNMKGVQVASMANWNRYEYRGLQLSGGLNFTRLLKGVQIGVVNVADSVAGGFMLGVVNWARNGFHVVELSANDVSPYNLSFKSGVDAFYTILRAGIDPHGGQLWDYGMGIGTLKRIKQRALIDLEATYHVIQPLDQRFIDGVNFETRAQLRFGYRVLEWLELIAGPVLHFMVFKPTDPTDLPFADRFGENTLSISQQDDRIRKWWLGYDVAVRFF